MCEISETIRVRVRFSEIDPIKMVWHGNYVKYMEDAREAFGRRYGLGYQLIFDSGYYAPVYDMHLRYMAPATLDDELDVKITWLDEPGAKICFTYGRPEAVTWSSRLIQSSCSLHMTDSWRHPSPVFTDIGKKV